MSSVGLLPFWPRKCKSVSWSEFNVLSFQFVYVNSAFSPNPDELVLDLCNVSCSFRCLLNWGMKFLLYRFFGVWTYLLVFLGPKNLLFVGEGHLIFAKFDALVWPPVCCLCLVDSAPLVRTAPV